PVDVDRHQPIELILSGLERALDRAQHANVLAFEFELERHLKQTRGARIPCVKPMAEAGRRVALADTAVDERLGRVVQRLSTADEGETGVEEPHARLDVAAMVRPE